MRWRSPFINGPAEQPHDREVAMQIGSPTTAPDFFEIAGDHRASGRRKSAVLLTGTVGRPDNFRLAYQQPVSGQKWDAPRHRHDFEQIRWVLDGDITIAKGQKIPPGWVAYFPESAYYGPQSRGDNLTLLLLQFGGPSGFGFDSPEQLRDGREALVAKGGTFEGGIYRWVDEAGVHRNQDAAEAVHEQIRGNALTYPGKRYQDLVLMDPESFAWIPDRDQPGVTWRRLGTFSEREVRIAFVQLEAGARFALGAQPATEIVFVKEGGVSLDGQDYPALTAFSSAADEQAQPLTATAATVLFYVKLPTF
jgi:hypothetical protein